MVGPYLLRKKTYLRISFILKSVLKVYVNPESGGRPINYENKKNIFKNTYPVRVFFPLLLLTVNLDLF